MKLCSAVNKAYSRLSHNGAGPLPESSEYSRSLALLGEAGLPGRSSGVSGIALLVHEAVEFGDGGRLERQLIR